MSQTPPIATSVEAPSPGAATPWVQKVITIVLWSMVALVMIGVGVGKFIPRHADIPVFFHAPAFSLLDQEGRPLASTDLSGSPYICDFIFTTCGSACPMLSRKMADLQKLTPPDVRLISFTVDPDHDTPAVLKAYAAGYGADPSRWHFLTGPSAQVLATIAQMKIGFQAASERSPIVHSEKFLLVDADGNVRGIYDSTDESAFKQLISDANWLGTGHKGH